MKRYFLLSVLLFPLFMSGQITTGDSTSSGIQFYQVYKNLSYQLSPYFSFDIDNDQIPDIKIEGAATYIMGGSVYSFQSLIHILDSVDIVATTTYTNWVDTMHVGTLIDSTLNWQKPASYFCIRSYQGGPFPSSCGIVNTTINSSSFIGFRKKSSNAYGWINISPYYPNSTSLVGITLRSYAVFGLQTSIKENAWDSGIKLYPNPTGLSLYFQLPQALNITGVSVKNILGEEIPVIDYKSNDSFINTSHFPNGVYFVELNTEKGKFSQKFVVNH